MTMPHPGSPPAQQQLWPPLGSPLGLPFGPVPHDCAYHVVGIQSAHSEDVGPLTVALVRCVSCAIVHVLELRGNWTLAQLRGEDFQKSDTDNTVRSKT
jgi:hypothetical protein